MTAAANGSVHHQDNNKPTILSTVLKVLGMIGSATGLTILTMYLLTTNFPGPSPDITLHDVKLHAFNFSNSSLNVQVPSLSTLTSTLQLTISCRNTDDSYGIHFDKVEVYASYGDQQITMPTMIRPSYLGHPDATVWSLNLNGTDVPVPNYLAASLAQDVANGAVPINVEVRGWLRYKELFTVRYRMKVHCPAYVTFGNTTDDKVHHSFVEGCYVHVKV